MFTLQLQNSTSPDDVNEDFTKGMIISSFKLQFLIKQNLLADWLGKR